MALLSIRAIGSESLENWKLIGSGGFGKVYKARHKEWGSDVAIKLPKDDKGDIELREEASYMGKVSYEFVLRLHGMYRGYLPDGEKLMQQGIVMEFMERGSIQTLLEALSVPPPWPLAFRLAHEVALGMNFLHWSKIMHNDLKPNNVLLNDDLHAKLADFGLSRVSASALTSPQDNTEKKGGSYKYMPPEAFDVSYKPVYTFDIYSYGILLWSVFNGKDPYPAATFELVALKIPEGNRPDCTKIDQMEAEELKELVDLMKRCWDGNPTNRPKFIECLKVTENVFSKHKGSIHDAVGQVKAILDSPPDNQCSNTNRPSSFTPEMPEKARVSSESNDTVDNRVVVQNYTPNNQRSNKSGPSSFTSQLPGKSESNYTLDARSAMQNSVNSTTRTLSPTEKEAFVNDKRTELIGQVSEVLAIVEELGDMVHPETYSVIYARDTSQEKMRVLYQRALRPGGVKVKAAFYDALKKHHPDLVERLGG